MLQEDPSEAIPLTYRSLCGKCCHPSFSPRPQGNNPLVGRSFHVNRANDDHHGKVKHKKLSKLFCCTTQFSPPIIKSAVPNHADSKIHISYFTTCESASNVYIFGSLRLINTEYFFLPFQIHILIYHKALSSPLSERMRKEAPLTLLCLWMDKPQLKTCF